MAADASHGCARVGTAGLQQTRCRRTFRLWTCSPASMRALPSPRWTFVRFGRPHSQWLCHRWESVRLNNKKCVVSAMMWSCVRTSVVCADDPVDFPGRALCCRFRTYAALRAHIVSRHRMYSVARRVVCARCPGCWRTYTSTEAARRHFEKSVVEGQCSPRARGSDTHVVPPAGPFACALCEDVLLSWESCSADVLLLHLDSRFVCTASAADLEVDLEA